MSELKIPNSWASAKLGNFLKIRRGASPRPVGDPKYFGNGECGWLKISDLTRQGKYITETREFVTNAGKAKSVYVPPGDLVLSNSATIGLPAITKIPICVHDGFLTFPNLPIEIDVDFLYNFFLAFRTQLQDKSIKGATQANLNIEIVSKIECPIPPVAEQRRIVAKIESLFSKVGIIQATLSEVSGYSKEIENGRTVIEKLKLSIFDKAFKGLLVPQDPAEGSGHEILEKIIQSMSSEEKTAPVPRLTKTKGKLKRVVK